VLQEVDGTAGTITFNHESKRNALSKPLIDEFISALDELKDAGVRSLIVRARPGVAV
jgi:methylmalonyl-CoA decarboxylase